MGRRAHLLRLALGRSADLPPNWEALTEEYERRDDDDDDDDNDESRSPRFVRIVPPGEAPHHTTYDEKGRPVDQMIRTLDEQRCEAQNAVLKLAVAITAESEEAEPMLLEDFKAEPYLDEDDCGSILAISTATMDLVQKHWLPSLLNRLLVFQSCASVPFVQLVSVELKNFGYVSFFLAGLPARILTKLLGVAVDVGFDELESRIVDYLPDAAIASNLPGAALQVVYFTLETFINVPPAIYYTLQELHLIPARRLLPPLSSWNPFSPSSPLHALTSLDPLPSLVPVTLVASRVVDLALSRLFDRFETETLSPAPPYFQKDVSDEHTSVLGKLSASSGRACTKLLQCMRWHRANDIPASSRRRAGLRPGAAHNDTELSTLPASSAGGALRALGGEVAFLAVRAFVMRAVTWGFLAAALPAQRGRAAWFSADVYPLLPNLGRRSLSLRLRHFGSIGLCLGLSAAVSFVNVGVVATLATWMGKRWYGWGRQVRRAETRVID